MFNIQQFRMEVVRPALETLNQWTQAAEELLILTCAQESLGGTYIKQMNGPALGIYQMEPDTHNDMWNSYLRRRHHEAYKILNAILARSQPQAKLMKYNLMYATLMARMFYLRFEEPLPAHSDVKGLAKYYKKYWNTDKGKATIEDAMTNYYAFSGKCSEKKDG